MPCVKFKDYFFKICIKMSLFAPDNTDINNINYNFYFQIEKHIHTHFT